MSSPEHVPGSLMVKLHWGETHAHADAFCRAIGAEFISWIRSARTVVVQVPAGSEEAWVAKLKGNPRVADVHVNRILRPPRRS